MSKRYRAPAAPFARKYTPPDIGLLAETDKANEDVCGSAIAHLLQRAYRVYGDTRYKRLTDQKSTPKKHQLFRRGPVKNKLKTDWQESIKLHF